VTECQSQHHQGVQECLRNMIADNGNTSTQAHNSQVETYTTPPPHRPQAQAACLPPPDSTNDATICPVCYSYLLLIPSYTLIAHSDCNCCVTPRPPPSRPHTHLRVFPRQQCPEAAPVMLPQAMEHHGAGGRVHTHGKRLRAEQHLGWGGTRGEGEVECSRHRGDGGEEDKPLLPMPMSAVVLAGSRRAT
jgi:hypothetical protein